MEHGFGVLMAEKDNDTAPSPGVYADLQSLVKLQYEARGFSFLPKQPVHSILSGRHNSRLRGRGMDFEEVRHYQRGDDIRSIDWKVTARTREPHTKVYTEERERPVLFIVDQSQSMFFGSQVAMKSVTAAQGAALGAWRVLAQGDRVGGLIFDDTEVVEVKPQRSKRAVLRLLKMIVEKNQALGVGRALEPARPMLAEALRRAVRLAKHDYLVVVISDFLDLDEDAVRQLVVLSRHNDVLGVLVYDPMERTLPEGRLVVSDGQGQIQVDTRGSGLREAFAESFEQRLRQVIDTLKRYGIPVMPIETITPIGPQVRHVLGQRLRAGRIRHR